MQIGRLRAVLLVECVLRTTLDQPVRELETAAGEHGQAVAGAELVLGNQHAPPAPPQLMNRHQAEPEIEPEAVPGKAAGTAQRNHDGIAYLGRDQHGRAVAAERERKVQIARDVQRGGDTGRPDQIDLLVAAGARGLGRALDVAQNQDPVVRGRDVARRIGHLGELGERLERGIKRGCAGRDRGWLRFHGCPTGGTGRGMPPDAPADRTTGRAARWRRHGKIVMPRCADIGPWHAPCYAPPCCT